MRIVFAGTPEFAAVALEALIQSGQQVVAVYTQPDRPAGRGRKSQPSPVKALALQHDLPVEQPFNFKDAHSITTLQSYRPEVMIVAAYGLLLPKAVLEIPNHGCLNIHASLLPRWRGAAPIQRAIAAGDLQTGITIMQMNEGLDTGDMLLKRSIPILADDTGGSVHDRLAKLGGQALLETLTLLQQQQLHPQPQDDSEACYASKLSKFEAWIDWSHTANGIDRLIRAFNPWPICQTQLEDKTIRIHRAEILGHDTVPAQPSPGTILGYSKQGIDVQCGQGQLRLLVCQLPNSKAMAVADLFNGHPNLFATCKQFSSPV